METVTPPRQPLSQSQHSAPPPSSSAMRLWRPAAQRNLRNQWTKLNSLRQDWRSATSAARSHSTAIVNSYLSQKYPPQPHQMTQWKLIHSYIWINSYTHMFLRLYVLLTHCIQNLGNRTTTSHIRVMLENIICLERYERDASKLKSLFTVYECYEFLVGWWMELPLWISPGIWMEWTLGCWVTCLIFEKKLVPNCSSSRCVLQILHFPFAWSSVHHAQFDLYLNYLNSEQCLNSNQQL